MLKIALASFLQHIQAQNTWAQPMLAKHARQSICVDATLLKAHLVILETGTFTLAGETATADATMTLTPSTLLRLAAKDTQAQHDVTITGDTQLASALGKVLSHLRWDIADDLSHVVGDIASEKIITGLQQAKSTMQASTENIGGMVNEYLHEEAMVLAKPEHVDTFMRSVDTLKSDSDRLAKRIARLQSRLNTSNKQQ